MAVETDNPTHDSLLLFDLTGHMVFGMELYQGTRLLWYLDILSWPGDYQDPGDGHVPKRAERQRGFTHMENCMNRVEQTEE